MKPNPSKYGHMGWSGASYECDPKVMSRSSQGHNNVKSAQKGKNLVFTPIVFV